MSSESNASKWVIGCLIAGVVGMLVCGGVIVGLGFLGFKTMKEVVEHIGPEIEFASQWTPPSADAGAEALFPTAVGSWTRTAQDDSAAISELALDRNGQHGTYESGGNKVDVYTYHVAMTEQAQVFDAALAAIDKAGYTTRSEQNQDFGVVHVMTFSFSPPERHGRMWWAHDWLVVTTTDKASVDLKDFERTYLKAMQGSAPANPAQMTPADQSAKDAQPEPAPSDAAAPEATKAPGETSPSDAPARSESGESGGADSASKTIDSAAEANPSPDEPLRAPGATEAPK